MKTIMTALILIGSAAFASEPPSAYYVAASIIKDSGIDDASDVSGTHIGTERFGSTEQTTHILHFNRGSKSYTCDFEFRTAPLTEDRHGVFAELSGCRSADGLLLRLNNDYTNDSGVAVFERVFFDDNSRFAPFTAEEHQRFSRRTGRSLREGSVKIINSPNSDRVILFNDGQLIPIN